MILMMVYWRLTTPTPQLSLYLQEFVSSTNKHLPLGEVFKHGQVVVARILATDIGDKQESAVEAARRK